MFLRINTIVTFGQFLFAKMHLFFEMNYDKYFFSTLTENPFTQRSESQIREQHNEIEFFRMTF